MNLDNLRPAWRQFRLSNSLRRMEQGEILFMLERAEGMALSKTNRFLTPSLVFVVLTICCQGG
jgi:hypothetical protein